MMLLYIYIIYSRMRRTRYSRPTVGLRRFGPIIIWSGMPRNLLEFE